MIQVAHFPNRGWFYKIVPNEGMFFPEQIIPIGPFPNKREATYQGRIAQDNLKRKMKEREDEENFRRNAEWETVG